MRKLVMGCAVAVLVALSARTEARPPGAVATILSQPAPPQVEVGVASWYGEDFNGNPTANGEVYDMNGLTAAHRELPMGTKVRLTNLLNRRSVTVRINDRGPVIPGRMIDVSMAAAKNLGFLRAGLAPVQMEVVNAPGGFPPPLNRRLTSASLHTAF
jgi:rare lipoprotein A